MTEDVGSVGVGFHNAAPLTRCKVGHLRNAVVVVGDDDVAVVVLPGLSHDMFADGGYAMNVEVVRGAEGDLRLDCGCEA